jgi:hypothetical protein
LGVFWIRDVVKKEAFRRRWRGGLQVTSTRLPQEKPEVFQRPPSTSDVNHGADEVSHHVVQEAVGRDPKLESQIAPGQPACLGNSAGVTSFGLARLGESLERMGTRKKAGGVVEQGGIELRHERPTPRALEGGSGCL